MAHISTILPQGRMPQSSPRNPQTVAFLDMLGLPYNLDPAAPVLAPLGGGGGGGAAAGACDSMWTAMKCVGFTNASRLMNLQF